MDRKLKSPKGNGICVNRRAGAANNNGVQFENMMFLSILLNLLQDGGVERFYVAQNVDAVGGFDDLVFLVKYKLNGEDKLVTKLFLVQLKHIIKKTVSLPSLTSACGNGNFNLNKYYTDYKTVVSNIGKFNDVVLDECQIEDMTFVLYTNADCNVGDNNYPKESLCRRLLGIERKKSNIFSVNSSTRFEKFYQELEKNNQPITNEIDGQKFLQQLVLFTGQGNVNVLQENIVKRLGSILKGENILVQESFDRAVKFVAENNSMWMSGHSGVLFDITINYQGFLVKLNDLRTFWGNPELFRKIIIKHICQEKNSYVTIGKIIKPINDYYITRKVVKDIEVHQYLKQITFTDSSNNSSQASMFETSAFDITQEQFVLLSAGPGMGKSMFFSYQAHLLKSLNTEKYCIRENLLDYSKYLSSMEITDNQILMTEKFLTEIAGVTEGTLEHDVFLCCLRGENMMIIFLDGVDEISPLYFDKVCIIIETLRDAFQVQLFASTRPVLQMQMKKYFKLHVAWELMEFTQNDAKLYLQVQCGVKDYVVSEAERLLVGIPLFCKMVGDLIKNNDIIDSNRITSKVDLYDKFVDLMYQLYHKEKEKANVTIPAVINSIAKKKQIMIEKYESAAVVALFSRNTISEWNVVRQCDAFLAELSEGYENIGLIDDITKENPIFVHKSMAEYFCGQWLARNTQRYNEYCETFGRTKFPVEVDYFMSSKLDNLHPLFTLVLNVKERSTIEKLLREYIDEFDAVDPLGRNVLHYVNIVKNIDALKFILFNGFTLTIEIVKLWLNDGTFIFEDISRNLLFRWITTALKKYPQHSPLLCLMLLDFRLKDVPYYLLQYSKDSPLHVAILNENKEDINILIKENLNSRNELGLTPLHVAVWMVDDNTVKLLGEQGAQYRNDNALGIYPHQVPTYLREELTRDLLKQFYDSFIQDDVLRADIMAQNYLLQDLPLHNAVQKKQLQTYVKVSSNSIVRLFRTRKLNAQSRRVDSKGRTALHVAAANASTELYDLQALNYKYIRDNNGYYPHQYVDDYNVYHLYMRLGFKFMLQLLPLENRLVCGVDVLEVLKWGHLDN